MARLAASPAAGPSALSLGLRLIGQKDLRIFILVPLAINLLLFVVLTSWLLSQFGSWLEWLMAFLPSWLSFLSSILWLLGSFMLLFVYGYSFGIITNLIAAPFNGLLAEKVEQKLTGQAPPAEPLLQLIPRTLARELIKLWYFISRGLVVLLLLFLLSFIPLLNLLVPVIGLAWGAWCMAIQYVDYPADNHRTPFTQLRAELGGQRLGSVSFGALVMLGNMVPVLNIFVMPCAVAGATVFWLRDIHGKALNPQSLIQ